MNKSIERKLLHFYTTGNIMEDFEEARARKINKIRRYIRACFYIHLAAAAVCIILAVILRAGALGIISVSVCEVILTFTAFLSVGDMTAFKTLLYCGDIAFAAAMFITGTFGGSKTPFYLIAAVSVVTALTALGAFFGAAFKEFLEDFPAERITSEHYTQLPNLSGISGSYIPELPDIPEVEEKPVEIPPQRSETQELAEKLKEILCKPKEEQQPEESKTELAQTEPRSDPALTADPAPAAETIRSTEVIQ